MPLKRELVNQEGQVVTHFVIGHDKYRLPDGTEMSINAAPAWCPECFDFVLVEVLESPDEMEAGARKFHTESLENVGKMLPRPPWDERAVADKLLAHLLHKAAQWRVALSSRQSPPRCLTCGGTRHELIPKDESWMDHPGEAGQKVRFGPGVSLLVMGSRSRLYDTEGRRITDEYARS